MASINALVDLNIVCVICARGGSERLLHKNILPIGGVPMIGWACQSALTSKHVRRVVISTDDEEIASAARKHGAETPFIRPAELCTSDASILDALKHAFFWIEENDRRQIDILVWFKPTKVFLSPDLIDSGIEMLVENLFLDTVLAAYPDKNGFYWFEEADGSYRHVSPDGAMLKHKTGKESNHWTANPGYLSIHRGSVFREGRDLYDTRCLDFLDVTLHGINHIEFSLDIDDSYGYWMAEKIVSEWYGRFITPPFRQPAMNLYNDD